MSSERIPMTREGYEKKRAELDYLQHTKMLEITKRVATAREMGDLSENAEYHAAREDQGMLQARVNMLSDKLSRAAVRVKDLDMDAEETFQIVGPGEDDPDENRILPTSPIAKGLMGKKKGDTVE